MPPTRRLLARPDRAGPRPVTLFHVTGERHVHMPDRLGRAGYAIDLRDGTDAAVVDLRPDLPDDAA